MDLTERRENEADINSKKTKKPGGRG